MNVKEKVAIITDGSCDIPKDLINKYDINIIPFNVIFGTKAYKTFGSWGDLTREEFYLKLETSLDFPTTAICSDYDIISVFKDVQKESDKIIGIFLSDKFSALIKNLHRIVTNSFSDLDLSIIDSKVATSTLGVLVLEAAKMANKGLKKEMIVKRIEDLIPEARLMVVLDSVDAVYRSGRVGWAKKFLVSSLKIKPIVNFKDGLIVSGGTLIGREKVIKKLKFAAPLVVKNAITDNIFIWHVRYPDLANELKEIMMQNNNQNKEIIIQEAGPVVGTHVGEKSIGFMYIGPYEKNWLLKGKE